MTSLPAREPRHHDLFSFEQYLIVTSQVWHVCSLFGLGFKYQW